MNDNPIKAALRQCRPLFWGAVWFSLFINLLMLAVPIYSLQVLDRVLTSNSTDTLIMLSIIVAAALVFMGLLQGLRAMVFAHISRWLDNSLSGEIVEKTVTLTLFRPAIGTQPVRDLGTIRNFVSSPALASAFDAPWAILFFIAVYIINVTLGIAVTLGACVLLILAILTEKIPSKQSAAANDSQIRANQSLDAILRNAEVVKAMGILPHAKRKFEDHNEENLRHAFSAKGTTTIISFSTRTLRLGLQVLITGLGAYLVIQGDLSAGAIVATSMIAGKALQPFDAAVSIFQGWVGVKKAYGRLIDMDMSVAEAGATTKLPDPVGRIDLDKITYQDRLSQRWILRGINIRIEPGEAIGIIGPSGSGKTTLARLLVGVLLPSSGAVRLDGAALGHWDPLQLGGLIGYLPQDVELFGGTVAENIGRLDPEASDQAVVAAARMAEVHDFILQLPEGYQTEIGRNGSSLSAGQRQRIGLARCFYGLPKLVVLDEPNANLDTEGEQALLQCLLNAREAGIATITIAHRPSILQKVDKILVLQAGEAKIFGPAEEVLAKMTQAGSNVRPIRKAPDHDEAQGERELQAEEV